MTGKKLMRVFDDRDADVNLIKTQKVAIVGYVQPRRCPCRSISATAVQRKLPWRYVEGSGSIAKAESGRVEGYDARAELPGWADVLMILAPDGIGADLPA